MKLSEVIRLGMTIVQEKHGYYLDYAEDGTPCGCLIGTACYAFGYREAAASSRRAISDLKLTSSVYVDHDDKGAYYCPICAFILEQKELDADSHKVLKDNLWNLYST